MERISCRGGEGGEVELVWNAACVCDLLSPVGGPLPPLPIADPHSSPAPAFVCVCVCVCVRE